jgi:hypothetical protein
MDKVIEIRKKMDYLLSEMYELGKEEGYDNGWDEAKVHFRTPDF